jgi:type I restriction enzyme S subunit
MITSLPMYFAPQGAAQAFWDVLREKLNPMLDNVAVCVSVPEAAYINQHLCLIRPNSDVLPVFLGVLLKCNLGQTYFDFFQYGLKQGLSLEDVREAPVLIPPLVEQTAIVDYVEMKSTKFDTLTTEAQRTIDLLQERRTALISAAVTGQIDVRGVV